MDKDTLKSVVEEVRRSIVRISFLWKPELVDREPEECMIIAGIIVSIDPDGSAKIIANPVFFKKSKNFSVRFPNDGGYEEPSVVSSSLVSDLSTDLSTFSLKPRTAGYIKPVKFEIGDPRKCKPVYAFVFPREEYVTPVGFTEGKIIDSTGVREENVRFFLHNCAMHEYGFLGSPVFTKRGHLVGISYLDRGYVQAWGVYQLQHGPLSKFHGISYVLDGAPLMP